MDVHSSIYSLLHTKSGISVWDKDKLSVLRGQQQGQKLTLLSQIIDQMGASSAKSQNLPQPITSTSKLMSSDTRLYLFSDGGKTIGMLKTGVKKLFYRNEVGTFREIEPICVLDFYVHESIQRRGVGYLLFEHMLQLENTNACKLAYDRPSSKLISFLKKRYGLSDYLPQSNNFVIFKRYFTTSSGYMDQRDSQLEWDTVETTTEEAVAAPTAASTATPMATAGTSTNTLNPPTTTTTVTSSPRTPQRRSHDIITGLKTNNANDVNSDKSNNDGGTRRGNKLSRTITVDEETDIGSVVDDDDTDSMCSSYASSYGNTSTGMHTPTKTSPYANSHNRVSTPNLNLRNTSSLHLSNQTDDVTQTPPGSGRKKFVQYNPISHAYEELEVTDSPWKSGRKLNLGYSPANQKVAEQQKQHQHQHQQQQVLLTSPQAQPPVYQSLNDSMTSLSLSDSSAPMPYGRRNR